MSMSMEDGILLKNRAGTAVYRSILKYVYVLTHICTSRYTAICNVPSFLSIKGEICVLVHMCDFPLQPFLVYVAPCGGEGATRNGRRRLLAGIIPEHQRNPAPQSPEDHAGRIPQGQKAKDENVYGAQKGTNWGLPV